MRTKINILKAYHGDCILIKTYDSKENEFVILIDGGTASTFDYHLKKELKHIKTIDLLVLTHIDSDHIAGLIRFIKNSLFEKIEIKKYWINAPQLLKIVTGDRISYDQGVTFEELLLNKNELSEKWDEEIYFKSKFTLPSFMTAEILSPTKEILGILFEKWPSVSKEMSNKLSKVLISNGVRSQIERGSLIELAKETFKPSKTITADIVNSSSIAFVLNLLDCSILLLGDSSSEVIVESLKKTGITNENQLEVDYVKISHHGSINNTSCELLDLIKCDNFIISTNGGSSFHKHPDREVIARIIYHPKRDKNKKRTIYFNYLLSEIQNKCGTLFNENDFLEGNWEVKDGINLLPILT